MLFMHGQVREQWKSDVLRMSSNVNNNAKFVKDGYEANSENGVLLSCMDVLQAKYWNVQGSDGQLIHLLSLKKG